MIIRNGFVKMVNGRWVNLSSIHSFAVSPISPTSKEFYISAIFKDKSLTTKEVEGIKYKKTQEAQKILDSTMENLFKQNG